MIMQSPTTSSRGPRYAMLAQTLMDTIKGGEYPGGSLLPTESELCIEYGVSRTTVREALRVLRDLGVVTPKAGVGTVVQTINSRPRFVHAIQSISDIFQYSKSTGKPALIGTSELKANDVDAQLLKCPVGQRWMKVETTRTFEDEQTPMVYVRSFLPMIYGGLIKLIPTRNEPMYSLIEQEFGERVAEVQQDFKAIRIAAKEARLFQEKVGSPGLAVVRHYLNEIDKIILVQISIYSGDRFSYAMKHRENRQGMT